LTQRPLTVRPLVARWTVKRPLWVQRLKGR
jgi:hypothetical protein